MQISLKTLESATAQEVFDQVAKHLLTQKQKSVGVHENGRVCCKYRGDNGLKCAVGCLIGDDEYSSEKFENRAWLTLVDDCVVPFTHMNLIVDLQTLHDNVGVSFWPKCLKAFAEERGLSTSAVDSLSQN